MHTVEMLDRALRHIQQAGYTVRQEWLGGAGGSDCEIRGRRYLFLDLAQSPAEQLQSVLEVLKRLQEAGCVPTAEQRPAAATVGAPPNEVPPAEALRRTA